MSEQRSCLPIKGPSCLFCLGSLVSLPHADHKGKPSQGHGAQLPSLLESKAIRSCMWQGHGITGGFAAYPPKLTHHSGWGVHLHPQAAAAIMSNRGASWEQTPTGLLRLWVGVPFFKTVGLIRSA